MNPEDGKVLLTGGTGFIGARLLTALNQKGFSVRCIVRGDPGRLGSECETVIGDLLDADSLPAAMEGVDTAYYLVHSMGAGRSGFEERDRQAAKNFVAAADKAGVRRIIYLGGLGEVGEGLSHHLASRQEVARILQSCRARTTILRAAVIIGAGGASYEIIKSLVEVLPVMITPRWVSTRAQPIAVTDVIGYLVGCLEEERTAGETFDIGGPEILTYRDMMEKFAAIEKLWNFIIPVPFLTPKLSSYWVGLFSSVKSSIAMPLIEGLKNEVICRDNRIRDLVPIPLTRYEEAVKKALAEERFLKSSKRT